ncbi:MAG: hypothetical protein MUE81_18020 [Thermoflexibacter sp.]|jgi:hypothetical protein|nr:hypothetical protein [Thermoflexibacter sp.]
MNENEVKNGSDLPEQVQEAKSLEISSQGNVEIALAQNAFSTFFTLRGNGKILIDCADRRITANSRVFVSISEFNSDARINRFIGAADFQVLNVAPYNGGVRVRINIAWGSPLPVRVDLLVDPSNI